MARTISSYFTKTAIIIILAVVVVGLGIFLIVKSEDKQRAVDIYEMPSTEGIISDQPFGKPAGPGEELFCFMVDLRPDGHFPERAGTQFPYVHYNGQGGYNYSLSAGQTVADGNVGRTEDGTYFVKESYLRQYVSFNQVYFKSGPSGWDNPVLMVKEGDMYVWRAGMQQSSASN